MKCNKHHIAGVVIVLVLIAIAVLLVFDVQKSSSHHHYWQLYRSPPVEPLDKSELQAQSAESIQKLDALLSKHFQRELKELSPVPAWLVQVANVNTESAAKKLLTQLQVLGFDGFIVSTSQQELSTYFVYAGPFTEQQEAADAINLIQQRLKVTGVLQQYSINGKD